MFIFCCSMPSLHVVVHHKSDHMQMQMYSNFIPFILSPMSLRWRRKKNSFVKKRMWKKSCFWPDIHVFVRKTKCKFLSEVLGSTFNIIYCVTSRSLLARISIPEELNEDTFPERMKDFQKKLWFNLLTWALL